MGHIEWQEWGRGRAMEQLFLLCLRRTQSEAGHGCDQCSAESERQARRVLSLTQST